MTGFIMENIGTILISMLLIVVIIAAVRYLINEKKQGKCSCGGSCGGNCRGCAMSSKCHGAQGAQNKKSI